METGQMFLLIIGILCLCAAVSCAYLALCFQRYDHSALNKAKARYPKFVDVLKGRAVVKHDFTPDGLVQAGMSYDYRQKKIIPNGRISDEVVSEFLRS
jgi:hypothetical protein